MPSSPSSSSDVLDLESFQRENLPLMHRRNVAPTSTPHDDDDDPTHLTLTRTQFRLLLSYALVATILILCLIFGLLIPSSSTTPSSTHLAQLPTTTTMAHEDTHTDDHHRDRTSTDSDYDHRRHRHHYDEPVLDGRPESVDPPTTPGPASEPIYDDDDDDATFDSRTSTIGAPINGDSISSTDSDTTYDQQIFPNPHFPWQTQNPLKLPPSSIRPTTSSSPSGEASSPSSTSACPSSSSSPGSIGVDDSWFGPLSYPSVPFLPSHHLRKDLPRFLHLTDLHLEPFYEPLKPSNDPRQPAICRRHIKTGDEMEFDWEKTTITTNDTTHHHHHPHLHHTKRNIFPVGRLGCDSPIDLIESTLEFVSTLSGGSTSSHASTTPASSSSSSPSSSVRPFDFTVLTGDLVAHFIDDPILHSRTLDHVLERLRMKLSKHSSHEGSILPTIGNTDLCPTNFIEKTNQTIPFRTVRQQREGQHNRTNNNIDDDDDKKSKRHSNKKKQKKDDDDADTDSIVLDCHPTFHRLLSHYVKHGMLTTPSAQSTFCRGGFYSQVFQDLNLRVIVLNTIVWSPNLIFEEVPTSSLVTDSEKDQDSSSTPASSPPPVVGSQPLESLPCSQRTSADPFDQFVWLEEELRQSMNQEDGESILFVGHIPPGHKDVPHEFGWCQQYVTRFQSIIEHANTTSTAAAAAASSSSSTSSVRKLNILTGVFGDFSEDVFRIMYGEEEEEEKKKKKKAHKDEKKIDKKKEKDAKKATHQQHEATSIQSTPSVSTSSMVDVSDVDSSISTSPVSSSSSPLPPSLLSIFVGPGVSPRKYLNPSVRVWYLEQQQQQDGNDLIHDSKDELGTNHMKHNTADKRFNSTNFSLEKKATEEEEEQQTPTSSSSWLKKIFPIVRDTTKQATTDNTDTDNSNSNNATHAAGGGRFTRDTVGTLRLFDYSQWYLPLQYANLASLNDSHWSWQYHYSFRSSYRLSDMSPSTLGLLPFHLSQQPLMMFQYQLHLSVNQLQGPIPRTYHEELCDIRFVNEKENRRCRRDGYGILV